MPTICLHIQSPQDAPDLRSQLVRLVLRGEGWVLEEKTLPPAGYSMRFEMPMAAIADFYMGLQEYGVLLTPMSHRRLTEMCLCDKHLESGDEARMISVHLHAATLAPNYPQAGHFTVQASA
jgi:hypothetical protein